MTSRLQPKYGTKTLQDMKDLQERGRLNLSPGFQRKSVWKAKDRKKLIQSILDGYPVPSIFLYKRIKDGNIVYDVLDGKQRLESIFMFAKARGFTRQGYSVEYQFPGMESRSYQWGDLDDQQRAELFLDYEVQTVEVDGDLADVIDLFIRINSTGKPLTGQEKRSAVYKDSPLLQQAHKIAKRKQHADYFAKNGIVTQTQIERQKDVELVVELIVSIIHGGPINKKAAVDRAIGNENIRKNQVKAAAKEFNQVLKILQSVLPEIEATRFRNISEFYTLFMVLYGQHKQRMVFSDKRRVADASSLLRKFSTQVDAVDVRVASRKHKSPKVAGDLHSRYLQSVRHSTDSIAQRTTRAEILASVLSGVFEKKDAQRAFSAEQRRILWNSSKEKTCESCGVSLSWKNFHADHVVAHSRGGKTNLENAAVLCVRCNTSKGAGRGRK